MLWLETNEADIHHTILAKDVSKELLSNWLGFLVQTIHSTDLRFFSIQNEIKLKSSPF